MNPHGAATTAEEKLSVSGSGVGCLQALCPPGDAAGDGEGWERWCRAPTALEVGCGFPFPAFSLQLGIPC